MLLMVMHTAHFAAQAVRAHILKACKPYTHHIDPGDQYPHPDYGGVKQPMATAPLLITPIATTPVLIAPIDTMLIKMIPGGALPIAISVGLEATARVFH
jgi:hypothetical protein